MAFKKVRWEKVVIERGLGQLNAGSEYVHSLLVAGF